MTMVSAAGYDNVPSHSTTNLIKKIIMITTPKPFVPEDLRDAILAIRSGDNYRVVSSKYKLSSRRIKATMLELEKYEQDGGQELTI